MNFWFILMIFHHRLLTHQLDNPPSLPGTIILQSGLLWLRYCSPVMLSKNKSMTFLCRVSSLSSLWLSPDRQMQRLNSGSITMQSTSERQGFISIKSIGVISIHCGISLKKWTFFLSLIKWHTRWFSRRHRNHFYVRMPTERNRKWIYMYIEEIISGAVKQMHFHLLIIFDVGHSWIECNFRIHYITVYDTYEWYNIPTPTFKHIPITLYRLHNPGSKTDVPHRWIQSRTISNLISFRRYQNPMGNYAKAISYFLALEIMLNDLETRNILWICIYVKN